jgi:hypothetical protein
MFYILQRVERGADISLLFSLVKNEGRLKIISLHYTQYEKEMTISNTRCFFGVWIEGIHTNN